LRAEIDALKAELATQRDQIAKNSHKLLPSEDLAFELEGYYRVRGHGFANFFADQERDARFFNQRLRVRPILNFRDLALFKFEVNALDNVVWGDNANLAATPLFAGSPSVTGPDGRETPNIQVSRAWMEFNIPVGLLRVGRQPSNWGMGLLAHDGNGFEEDFGEYNGGATYDRAIFATKPIAIVDAAASTGGGDIPLFVAIGVDRLVEDPLYQYYGYTCELGEVVEANSPCDNDGDGLSDEDHSYVNEDRVSDQRGLDWWADQDDDVWEMIYALIYRGEDVDYLGGNGDLTVGVYAVNRKQNETDSNIWIADAYVKAQVHGVYFEFEGLTIQGNSSAIALAGSYDPSGTQPLYKEPAIYGYVAKAGYVQPNYSAIFETGYASGDSNVADKEFTGRALHSDHNVGLLLYEQVIAQVTAKLWSEGAASLWSSGGVYNSRYIFPVASYSPLDSWRLVAGFLMAFPDQPDGRFVLCSDGEDCPQTSATSNILGWELDWAVKHRFHEHLLFSLEFGYAHATDRLPLVGAGLNPKGNFFTYQTRMAYEF
jgi:hypothetical protein